MTLPLTLGPLLADALDPRADEFRSTVSVGCWVVWAATLVAMLVPRDLTLTVVRVVVPAAVPAAAWAALATDDDGGRTGVVGSRVERVGEQRAEREREGHPEDPQRGESEVEHGARRLTHPPVAVTAGR